MITKQEHVIARAYSLALGEDPDMLWVLPKLAGQAPYKITVNNDYLCNTETVVQRWELDLRHIKKTMALMEATLQMRALKGPTPEALYKEALDNLINAWESLPGGQHVAIDQVETWLSDKMKPAIDKARETLGYDITGE